MSLLSTSAYLLATAVCISLTIEVMGGGISNSATIRLNALPAVQPNVPSRMSADGLPNTSVLELVHSFVRYFNQSVQADPKLKNAFDIHRLGGAKQAEKFYYDFVYRVHAEIGDLKPEFAARTVADAVCANFEKVTTDSHIGIFGFSTGYLAYVQGAITPENFIYLSRNFYETVKAVVYAVADPSSEAQLNGVVNGFIGFLTFYGFWRQDNAPLLAVLFANEWYKL